MREGLDIYRKRKKTGGSQELDTKHLDTIRKALGIGIGGGTILYSVQSQTACCIDSAMIHISYCVSPSRWRKLTIVERLLSAILGWNSNLALQDLGIFLISVEKEPEMKAMQDTNPQRLKAIDPAEDLGPTIDLSGQAS